MDKETTYLLGAGFNQHIENWDEVKPPLANNFFINLLKSKKFNNDNFQEELKPLFDFIYEIWKKDKENLRNSPFNLEGLFTYIEKKLEKAIKIGNKINTRRFYTLNEKFMYLLAQFLAEFDPFIAKSPIYLQFGKMIYDSKPNLITFNYDTILEHIIESVSMPQSGIPQNFKTIRSSKNLSADVLSYSHFNWNRPLFYGIKFDQVQLHQAGPSKVVKGEKFYSTSGNEISEWRILKLHGSLNWFRVLPIREYSPHPNEDVQETVDKIKGLLLLNNKWLGTYKSPEYNGWLLRPIIITPVLYKEKYYQEKPFKELWKVAKEELRFTKKLIVIGYSFSATDFSVRELFLDSFKINELDELIVVNPDIKVAKIVKDLTHFDKQVTICHDLNELLAII